MNRLARTTTVQPSSLAAPALRTFFRIADEWGLRTEEQRSLLGDPPSSTFFKWKKTPPDTLPRDFLERISYVLGIYKALQILLPDPMQANAWISHPNTAPVFAGVSPLARMLSGNVADLFVVRQYLDAQRGWN